MTLYQARNPVHLEMSDCKCKKIIISKKVICITCGKELKELEYFHNMEQKWKKLDQTDFKKLENL